MINKIIKLIKLTFYLLILLLSYAIKILLFRGINEEFNLKNKKVAFFDTKIPNESSAGERSFIGLYHHLEQHSKMSFFLKKRKGICLDSDIANVELISLATPILSRRKLLGIDYVVIMSPEAYLAFNVLSLLLLVNVRIVYYSTDIFSLRYGNEFDINNSLTSLFYSYYYKLSEPLIWRLSVFCLSNRDDESSVIQKHNKNTSVIPTRVFYNLPKVDYKIFNDKQGEAIDFLFIGGAGNAPNISAVDFIVDELIHELDKTFSHAYVIHIVGSGWKKYLVNKGISYNNVIVHGVISDQDLNNLYKKCFFSLATLKYGAGVKGKVIEAMLNSLIVIATPVGVEGITCKTLRSCSTAECMVSECNEILLDKYFWKLTVDGYYHYLDKNFSESAMNNGLRL